MPSFDTLRPIPTARQLGLAVVLAGSVSANALAQQADRKGAADMSAADDSETRLFAPIPRWEAPPPPPDPILATPSFMAPSLDKRSAARERTVRNGLARPEIDATPIRRGLGPAASPLPSVTERAVGVKIGAERLSVETAIVSGQGAWQRNDTRFDWNVARRSSDGNLVWSAAAGGNLQTSGSAGQNAQAVLGYRLQPLDIVTLTTEIAIAGNYAFATENGLSSTVTPRVKVIADLTQPLAMPWRTILDVNLDRQVPMSGSGFQTNASAMLRLQLPTP